MRDITETALRQSSEFGRPVRMNFTRVGNYISKTERIFKIFAAEEMTVRIEAGGRKVEERRMKLVKAKRRVRWYGEKFFMEMHYTYDGVLILTLTGVAPEKEKKEEDGLGA